MSHLLGRPPATATGDSNLNDLIYSSPGSLEEGRDEGAGFAGPGGAAGSGAACAVAPEAPAGPARTATRREDEERYRSRTVVARGKESLAGPELEGTAAAAQVQPDAVSAPRGR